MVANPSVRMLPRILGGGEAASDQGQSGKNDRLSALSNTGRKALTGTLAGLGVVQTEAVDYITTEISLSHIERLDLGSVVLVSAHGEKEGQFPRNARIAGRGGVTSLAVRVRGNKLRIDGNLYEFLHANNLDGSPDLRALMEEVVENLCGRWGMPLTPDDRNILRAGLYSLSRVDLSRTIKLDPQINVSDLLHDLATAAVARHQTTTYWPGESVLFDQGSRQSSTSLYAKHGEMRRSLPHDHPDREDLLRRGKNTLRCETRLRDGWLRYHEHNTALTWDQALVTSILDARIGKIPIPTGTPQADPWLAHLEVNIQRTYYAWLGGGDVRQLFSAKTLRLHRRAIRDLLGVDIAQPRPHTNGGGRTRNQF